MCIYVVRSVCGLCQTEEVEPALSQSAAAAGASCHVCECVCLFTHLENFTRLKNIFFFLRLGTSADSSSARRSPPRSPGRRESRSGACVCLFTDLDNFTRLKNSFFFLVARVTCKFRFFAAIAFAFAWSQSVQLGCVRLFVHRPGELHTPQEQFFFFCGEGSRANSGSSRSPSRSPSRSAPNTHTHHTHTPNARNSSTCLITRCTGHAPHTHTHTHTHTHKTATQQLTVWAARATSCNSR